MTEPRVILIGVNKRSRLFRRTVYSARSNQRLDCIQVEFPDETRIIITLTELKQRAKRKSKMKRNYS